MKVRDKISLTIMLPSRPMIMYIHPLSTVHYLLQKDTKEITFCYKINSVSQNETYIEKL